MRCAALDHLRLACHPWLARRAKVGADDQDRTGDLVLTKDALCQLSYIGPLDGGWLVGGSWKARGAATSPLGCDPPSPRTAIYHPLTNLERETGIEPATNSLEGCDSTTELLPPLCLQLVPIRLYRNGGEGRTRTFEAARATDLQSAAFDRFATSPIVSECCFERSPQKSRSVDGAGEGIRTPDLLITNQLLYRP